MIRILFILLLSVLSSFGQLTFRYIDRAGFGFNDQTPTNPVGGNTGTTLGQQRRIVLERAGEIWTSFIEFNGPVEVRAQFNNNACSALGATLAAAGPLGSQRNFPNAPLQNVTYPAALVNHLTGTDRFPGASEIQVLVNEEVDSDDSCLGGGGFYYGLDGQAGFSVDLLATLAHELGHGLGFLSFVDETTGQFPGGFVDIYSTYLRDLDIGKDWEDMTNNERRISATNDPFVVWTGESTNAAAGLQLSTGTNVEVTFTVPGSPEQIVDGARSQFGPQFPSSGLSGEIALIDDGVVPVTDACEDVPLANRAALEGKIVLIDRGVCFFIEKVNRAEAAGAAAVIIANNLDDGFFSPGFDPNDAFPEPTIPSLMVSLAVGAQLRSQANLAVTIDRGQSTGSNGGFLRVFAPDPVDFGSSISHWHPEASPNLLMEPFLSSLPRQDPDLTLTAMREMGWTVRDIPFPNLTYDIWSDMFLGEVAANLRSPEDDPDNDGKTNLEEYALGTNPNDSESYADLDLKLQADEQELTFEQSNQPTDVAVNIYASETLLPDSFELAGDLNELSGEISGEMIERRFSFEVDRARRFFSIGIDAE